MKKILLTTCYLLLATCILAQLNTPKYTFTRADSLRGSNNEYRNWWDVKLYNLEITPNIENKTIQGVCHINFTIDSNILKEKLLHKSGIIQIDLQDSLVIDSAIASKVIRETKFYITDEKKLPLSDNYEIIPAENKRLKFNFSKNGFAYFFDIIELLDSKITEHSNLFEISFYFHGKPREAKNAPWDGGWVWKKDKLDRPFVSVACQGLGASCWFPCKDYQGDEPDYRSNIYITIPDSLVGVSNGVNRTATYVPNVKPAKLDSFLNYDIYRLQPRKLKCFTWHMENPINTYCIVPYIGNYVNFTDTFIGEKGTLDLSYWVLDYNKEKAEEQFKQVKPMLKAFEYWFGAYPFYEDGYKLVEAPYLGMEHQSAIAYGNGYKNGYKGRDLSGSGWGLKWDFIIVHESGHEWFANSITTNDIADMWVHEGFTNYSEVLFTEYYYGKQAGNEYCYGLRKNIRNDEPIIGPYGVNKEGSGDMYYKAANMIHSIRNALNDDEKFRKILRGMNEKFYHKTIDGKDIQQYLIEQTGLDLQKTFEQYLTTTQIPKLEYYYKGKKLFYRYTNCVAGFNMPITIPPTNKTIIPTTEWQHKRMKRKNKEWFGKKNVEFLYLLKVEEVKAQ